MSARVPTEAEVRAQLARVIDPEMGVNIVDLGLVYGVHLEGDRLRITLTMTSPACPMAGMIVEEVHFALAPLVPHGIAVQVELVWQPPWTPERLSPAARAQLGWTGDHAA